MLKRSDTRGSTVVENAKEDGGLVVVCQEMLLPLSECRVQTQPMLSRLEQTLCGRGETARFVNRLWVLAFPQVDHSHTIRHHLAAQTQQFKPAK